jgi:hypothetical protein
MYSHPLKLLSLKIEVISASNKAVTIKFPYKRILPNGQSEKNQNFISGLVSLLVATTLVIWLCFLLILSGDIHLNPGPSTSSISSNSTSCSSDVYDFLNLPHHLSVIHYNVQSLQHKIDIVISELGSFDVLAFTETWLNASIPSSDLLIPNFHNPLRKDRTGDSHGGVILYIKDSIPCLRRPDLELNNLESIWVELKLPGRKNILLSVFYRPPNSDNIYNTLLESSIGLAVDTDISDIIIVGDFNMNTSIPSSQRKIASLCQQNNLTQLITEPTNFTEHSASTIDLLFVSKPDSVITSGVGEPFLDQNIRYHCPIFGIFRYSKPKSKIFPRIVWNYNRADFDLLRQKLVDIDWNSIKDDNIDLYAKTFSDVLNNISCQCIPNRKVSINTQDPPWLNGLIKKKIRQRKRLYRKAKRTNVPAHWTKFKKFRNETVNLIRNTKLQYYQSLGLKLQTLPLSSKDWWKILKSFINPNSNKSIPPLFDESSNTLITDTKLKANLLNNFFSSQTVIDDTNHMLPALPNLQGQPCIDNITITPSDVRDILKSLPLGKASGPDGINGRILRECASELSQPLCDLFNYSLMTCCVPSSWKHANVCAVFKKGDPSFPNNYRPISLLNIIEKVFERIIFKSIFNFYRETGFFTPFQSGFLPGDSTVNQLTFLYNSFCKALDNGLEVRVVFFDISKAFDKVWHRGLIFKLEKSGIRGNILKWFTNYLSDRSQKVVIPGTNSDDSLIFAGVPQGSILGPLLFLVYINDIVTEIGSVINLFADDTSLYMIVNNPNDTALQLQEDIDRISQWANTWLVKFNPAKSESLTISRKINKPHHPTLFMLQAPIQTVQEHKHLGMFFSSDGSWHSHITYIKEKAWTRIHIMRRLKYTLNRKSLEIIYISFIRPVLEYSDVVWDNCCQYEKDELDKIQLEAARIVTGCTKLVSTNELLQEIGWEKLSERRRKHKLILFFKMIHNLTPAYLSSLVPASIGHNTSYNLRNANDLQTPFSRTVLYAKSFLPSVINDWNSLPEEARHIHSLNNFKKFLNTNLPKPNTLFYNGERRAQILHTRLRTKCSALNHHLFQKNIVASPLCSCGAIETTQHFFFHCPLYTIIRETLLRSITPLGSLTLTTLLKGDATKGLTINSKIFEAVQTFIISSKRFDT